MVTLVVALAAMVVGGMADVLEQQITPRALAAAVMWVAASLAALLLLVAWIVFPWCIWRIMRDVRAMRRRAEAAEQNHARGISAHIELMRQQIEQMQSINAKLLGAEIARDED